MRKFFSVLLSLLLVMTLVPINSHASKEKEVPLDEYDVRGGTQAAYNVLATANEWDEEWTKKDVSLLHEWTINFSDIATKEKIEAITIEHKGKSILVDLNYDQKIVKVKPRARYLAGQNYTLKVLLKNGKKYKMDFTTTKKGVDVELNNTAGSASNLYVNETIEGTVSAGDTADFYRLSVPQNGELKLSLSSTSALSMTLFDRNATDGDKLAYKDDTKAITLTRELKGGAYYVRVEGEGNYTLDVKHTAKSISPEQALVTAQDAVYALPARVDVQGKHREEIDQAITLINTAKLVGADALEIEKLERMITELNDVILPIEVTALISNSKTVLLTFNRPVQSKLAYITVDGKVAKTVTFNANQTIARVEMAETIDPGTRTVSVKGIAPEPIESKFSVVEEKATAIEIIGNTANRIGGNIVTVPYRVFNQYGEEMDSVEVTATRTIAGSSAEIDVDVDPETGLVKIPIDSTLITEGDSITLKLKAGDVTKDKTVTVSFKAAVATVEIKGLNKADLNERTKLKDEPFYLIIEAKDRFENPITDIDLLNQEGNIHIFNYAPKIVGIAPKFEKVGDEIRLPLTGTPTLGTTTVTLTALQTKAESSFEIKVDESTRTDTIKLIVRTEAVIEGKPLLVEIQATDKSGNLITEAEILKNPTSGIEWTIEPFTKYQVIDGKDGGNPKLTIEGEYITQGTITITAQTTTSKKDTLRVDVAEKVRPTRWEETSILRKEYKFRSDASTPSEDEAEDNENTPPIITKLNEETLTIFDQYDKVLSDPFTGTEYHLVLTEKNPKGGAIKLEDNEVQAIAVGTETVTIAIYNGNKLVEGSTKDITFTVTDDSEYVRYEIAPIDAMYDIGVKRETLESVSAYDPEVIVLGVLASGKGRGILDPSKYEIEASLNQDFEIIDNKLRPNSSKLYYGKEEEITRDLTVTISSSKEQIKQEVIISKVPPKVASIEVTTTPINYNPIDNEGKGKAFTLDDLLAATTITATDQYGVESEPLSPNNKTFKFPDGTESVPSILFTTVEGKGAHLFDGNGTPSAKVTDFSPNSSFKAVLSANGVSASITVQVEKGDMPSLQAEIGKITVGKMGILKHGQNVQTIAQGLVNEKYSVTIKESRNEAIAQDGTVTQGKEKIEEAAVIFTVTHKEKSAFKQDIEVELTVEAAKTVLLTQDSLGEPAEGSIIGLKADKRYIVQVGNNYFGVKATGTLSDSPTDKNSAEALAEPLSGVVIRELENGMIYTVIDAGPKKLTGVTATAGNTTATVHFPAPRGADTVFIEQSEQLNDGTSTDWKPANTEKLNASSTTATVTGLTNGTKYHFRVRVTGGEYAGVSNEVINIVPIAVIDIYTISGVAPISGEAPKTMTVDITQYTAMIQWETSHSSFESGQTYKARITLKQKTGYTLQGVPEGYFFVTGAEIEKVTYSEDSVIIEAEFLVKDPDPVPGEEDSGA